MAQHHEQGAGAFYIINASIVKVSGCPLKLPPGVRCRLYASPKLFPLIPNDRPEIPDAVRQVIGDFEFGAGP